MRRGASRWPNRTLPGVSTATVSRALRGLPPRTRKGVEIRWNNVERRVRDADFARELVTGTYQLAGRLMLTLDARQAVDESLYLRRGMPRE